MKVGKKRPSPALVIAMIALIVTLGGVAYAKLPKHSVGSRQLKPKSVTTKKFANDAIRGSKVARKTLTGRNFKVSQFATVPSATTAGSAGDSSTVSGHPAACAAGTVLVRGSCYDSTPQGPILGVKAASDACAARGGFLPSPMEVYAIRGVVPLGDGNGSNAVFTDSIAANTAGVDYGTTVVYDTDAKFVQLENEKKELVANYHYVCAFKLVH